MTNTEQYVIEKIKDYNPDLRDFTIKANDIIRGYILDSLEYMELIISIEGDHNIDFTADETKLPLSIYDLAKLVDEKLKTEK